MNKALRILVALPGILFVFSGVRWVVDPAGAAETVGMPLLEGAALSAQIGDLGAFFLVLGLMMLIAVTTLKRAWFLAPAMLVGVTAVFRILAWLLHDAALVPSAIIVEVVVASLLVFAAMRLTNE